MTTPTRLARLVRLTALGLAAVLAAGCSGLEVRLDTYLADQARGLTLRELALVPNAEAENPLLDQELLRHVEGLLATRGIAAVEPDEAAFGLIVSTSISDPTSTLVPGPVWQPTGAYFATVNGANVTTITPVTTFGPAYAPGSTVRYTHRLSLMLFELDAYRATGELAPLWIGDARHFGRSSDLRSVARKLAIALVEYLGTDTGEEIRVVVDA